ncbi:tyrosine protein phosphatase 1 [Orobanche minor]
MANTTAATQPFDITAVLTAEIAPLSEDQLRCCSDVVAFFEEKTSSLQTIHNEFEILQKPTNGTPGPGGPLEIGGLVPSGFLHLSWAGPAPFQIP